MPPFLEGTLHVQEELSQQVIKAMCRNFATSAM